MAEENPIVAAVEEAPAASVAADEPRAEGDTVLAVVQSLVVTVVIALFVITFVVQAFQIPSQSMEDTLLIGDYLLVDKVHYAHGGMWSALLPYEAIHRGEIIVFRYPIDPGQHFVKRVIAIPGDHIRLVNKQVEINGQPVQEPYVVHTRHDQDGYRDNFPRGNRVAAQVDARWYLEMQHRVYHGELIVPPESYFVMGDNRDESYDSRYWGFVPRENVVGRPLVIYFSLGQHSGGADGRISVLGTLTRLLGVARWDRTLRLVR
jgi:signal peptidase I